MELISKLILLMTMMLLTSESTQDEQGENVNSFGISFYQELLKDPNNNGKSLIFSPFSIQMAGGLLYGGASGKTASEMVNGFKLISNNSKTVGESFGNYLSTRAKDPSMTILNKIYLKRDETIAPSFEDIAKNLFHSDVENIDFNKNELAAGKMSKWVEDNTSGKIKDFIKADNVNSDTIMFLLNVINFKGQWQLKFDKEGTQKDDFWLNENDSIQVDMMQITDEFRTGYFNDLKAHSVEIPFKGTDLSFYILKPVRKEYKLSDIESKLSTGLLKQMFEETRKGKLVLKMPRFKSESSINMKEILANLKMTSMFGTDADFSKLLESGDATLYLSEALHKAAIEVDEEGVKAQAATGMGVSTRTGPQTFKANSPFIYFIKGSNSEIYFMGRYMGQ